jgi:hypothetical protein
MTERCALYYCMSALFTAKTLIKNVIKLNKKLGSEHYYSMTKQRALRSDTSQVLNEMFILKHRRTTAYISTSCNKIITFVGSSKGLEILVITNTVKTPLNSKIIQAIFSIFTFK